MVIASEATFARSISVCVDESLRDLPCMFVVHVLIGSAVSQISSDCGERSEHGLLLLYWEGNRGFRAQIMHRAMIVNPLESVSARDL